MRSSHVFLKVLPFLIPWQDRARKHGGIYLHGVEQHVLEGAGSWSTTDQAAVDMPDLALHTQRRVRCLVLQGSCAVLKYDLSVSVPPPKSMETCEQPLLHSMVIRVHSRCSLS